ncbi:hypothetical protein [Acidovorax sp. ACV01]|uniref:hypothetical protein n=1 Tax=Acidovorax sp. ACV01 TaxID=2769311 RepID=UPI001787608F|nr:hypothetical protein [Acidovorax sp. ACV01]MBD9393636.1 hypothetical protein [Acidovorax sp. ACV01]
MNPALPMAHPMAGGSDACVPWVAWLCLRLAMALLPGVVAAQAGKPAVATSPVLPPTVMACGLAFELPVQYRITRPRRTEGSGGMGVCAFDVVPAINPPKVLECKNKDEGGSPPYNVCDWTLSGVTDWPTVQVARTRIEVDHQPMEPFQFEGGVWLLPKVGAEALARTRFFGKRAYLGEAVAGSTWYRTRIKKYESIHAGVGSVDAVLMQLTPQLAVVLVSPPTDSSEGGLEACRIFCGSLRAAGRPADEPSSKGAVSAQGAARGSPRPNSN